MSNPGRMKNTFIPLLLAASTLACDQFLTVTTIDEVFSNSQADNAMASASTVLEMATASGDVTCDVRLNRSGANTNRAERNVIDTDSQLRTIFGQPGYVKVVHQINRCNSTTNVAIIGCAVKHNMIVEDLRDNGAPNEPLQGVLWAHEFGHTQGLPHRVVATSTCLTCEAGVCYDICAGFPPPPNMFVMAPSISTANVVINNTECTAFKKPLTESITIPCTVCEGGLCYNQCNLGFGGVGAGAEGTSQKAPIREFVKRIYPDAMPIDEMLQYGAEDVPALAEILSDSKEQSSWPMATSLLGMIGGDGSARTLIDFVVHERTGRVSNGTDRGISAAIVALGYLVERSGSRLALDFLMEASDPGFWDRQPGMRWTNEFGARIGARNRRLTDFAVMGLGLSAHPDAKLALQRRWKTLNQHAGGGTAEEQDEAKELVEQAMDDHARVSRVGLAAYYRRH